MQVESSWHKSMYDQAFASRTIDSHEFHQAATKEVEFLVKQFNLPHGATILDVACGTGRHSKCFAQSGYDVIGIDINPLLLSIAEKNCQDVSAKFEQADMLELSRFYGKFDVCVCLFSSFGYFDTDQKNESVLHEMAKTLRPGGTLVIHLIDREWLMSIFSPVSISETETEFQLEARMYDSKTHYNEVHSIVVNKNTNLAKRYYHKMRLYSSGEMLSLLQSAGFSDVQIFGDFNGGLLSKGKSAHPIYVASLEKQRFS